MIYIIILVFFLFAKFVNYMDNKRVTRSTEAVEKAQAEWYAWIDEHMKPIPAREVKAYTETVIAETWGDNGMEYRPKNVKQVTTAKERKERAKAYHSGKTYAPKLNDDQILELALEMIPQDKYDWANDVRSFSEDEARAIALRLNEWAKENL